MKKQAIAISRKKDDPSSLLGFKLGNIQLSRHILVDIVAMLDMTLVILSAFVLKYIYVQSYYDDDISLSDQGWINYFSITALLVAVLYSALRWRNHYSYNDFEEWEVWRGGLRLAATVIFAFGFSLSVVFMLKHSEQFSRVWVIGWCSLSFLILFTTKLFWVSQFRRLAAKGLFRRRVFLIGAGPMLASAHANLLSVPHSVDLVGVSDLEDVAATETENSNALNLALDRVLKKGISGSIDEVVIAFPGGSSALLDPIIQRLRMLPIDLKVALDLGTYKYRPLELNHLGGTNTVSVQKRPMSDWDVFIKALEDRTLGLLALIAFLPAMAAIAVLIKLDSKGPVFFRQRRHGLNHKVIEVMKFRTMTVMEDGDQIKQATKNDDRFTRVGRFLRKTSLDELPQLFNVLAGDMSLVGPRPHALAHNNYYSEMLEDYASRHRVKPGITGWAQVNGFRGEITGPDLMAERIRYDLEYIDNWSIWFDLHILFMTPFYGFISKRAY